MIKLFYELILGVLWSISIMLHGDSDSCGNDVNDGGGVQNVSDGIDGDDMMIMPMTTMRMVGGVDGVSDRGNEDDKNNNEDNNDGGKTTIKWYTDWRRDNNWDNDDNDVRNNEGGGDKGDSVDGRRQQKR